jgi:hypothetical protein
LIYLQDYCVWELRSHDHKFTKIVTIDKSNKNSSMFVRKICFYWLNKTFDCFDILIFVNYDFRKHFVSENFQNTNARYHKIKLKFWGQKFDIMLAITWALASANCYWKLYLEKTSGNVIFHIIQLSGHLLVIVICNKLIYYYILYI